MTFTVFPEVRGLVLETNDPVLVLQKVPTAFSLGPTTVGMPHGLEETLRLSTYLGLQPPAPVESYYDWPRERVMVPEPFAHQLDTTGFLTMNPRSYCLNDIGTGKTLSAAWAADYLMREGAVTRCAVLAPLSALARAWSDTFFYHFPKRTFSVLHGSADRRRRLLAQDRDFYIINHDGVGVIQKELLARDDIDLWIIDELAVYRNPRTAKWKALHEILYPVKGPPKSWVWGLTGSPIPQEPTDAYGQCRLVTPTTVPKYYTHFRNMVMEHQSTYIWTPRKEATQIVYKAMRPAIRYKRDDCLDLPGEITSQREVEMSAEQKKHYKEIMRELYTEIRGGRITAVNEGVKRLKLLQIACGVVYDTNGKPHEIDAGSRIEELLSLIEQCNEKVIVFVPFTEVTNMLHREIVKHWSCAIVYGGVPKNERDQIFGDFQKKPDPSVLVAHPGCMAHSLTLTEASTIIWYAPVDSNDTYTQANGRITRASQKYVANIIQLAGSTVERKMYARLSARQSTQGVLLAMVEAGEQ